jgi:hypothetical protein
VDLRRAADRTHPTPLTRSPPLARSLAGASTEFQADVVKELCRMKLQEGFDVETNKFSGGRQPSRGWVGVCRATCARRSAGHAWPPDINDALGPAAQQVTRSQGRRAR